MRIGVFGNRNILSRCGQAEEITRAFITELDELQAGSDLGVGDLGSCLVSQAERVAPRGPGLH